MKAGSPQGHIPVLVDEVVQFLEPNNHGFYVDGTVGLGGHAAAILQKSAPNGFLLGIDLDSEALAIAKERLREYKDRVALVGGNFAHLDRLPQLHRGSAHPETTMPQIDGILFDLGVSSLQLDTPTRGFSFTHSGPLDMRMDANRSVSAAHVVNHHSENALATIFTQFGQERWAKESHARLLALENASLFQQPVNWLKLFWRRFPPNQEVDGSIPQQGFFRRYESILTTNSKIFIPGYVVLFLL